MKGGEPKTRDKEQDPANLDESELVSNQEAAVVPWFAGERKIALTWISPVYDLVSKAGPISTGGK